MAPQRNLIYAFSAGRIAFGLALLGARNGTVAVAAGAVAGAILTALVEE